VHIIAHGDIDGIASAALVLANEFKGADVPVYYETPFSIQDAKGAIVVDISIDRTNTAKTIRCLEDCHAWIDHHHGWRMSHEKLFVRNDPSCASVVWDYYRCTDLRHLVDIASECDNGYPTGKDAIIYHKTLKTDLYNRPVKDLILATMLGRMSTSFLRPYVEKYDAEILPVTEHLLEGIEVIGNAAFVNATEPGGSYDKNRILTELTAKAKYGCVITSRGQNIYTTVATRDPSVNLVDVFNMRAGSPGRVTLRGNEIWKISRL